MMAINRQGKSILMYITCCETYELKPLKALSDLALRSAGIDLYSLKREIHEMQNIFKCCFLF